MRISKLLAFCMLSLGFPAFVAEASITSGDLYFTRFSGTPNVQTVTYDFDGVSFTLGTPAAVGTTVGADGITGNPKNSDLLIVGGQGPRINTISKSTGLATSYASPVSVFHLEVPDGDYVFATGIPGAMARHFINADGSIGVGTVIPVSFPTGLSTTITQLIDTPSGFYYTASGPGGFGSFGTITFNTGNHVTATSATVSVMHGLGGSVSPSVLEAAHGGVYDPLTNTIILGGDGHITQLSLTGAVLADRTFAGMTFDQGTVDGEGHLFWASNSGHLLFMDYGANGAASQLDDVGVFSSIQFLASNLDDIAPLVGSGTTAEIPEPLSLAVWSVLGIGGVVATRRGQKATK